MWVEFYKLFGHREGWSLSLNMTYFSLSTSMNICSKHHILTPSDGSVSCSWSFPGVVGLPTHGSIHGRSDSRWWCWKGYCWSSMYSASTMIISAMIFMIERRISWPIQLHTLSISIGSEGKSCSRIRRVFSSSKSPNRLPSLKVMPHRLTNLFPRQKSPMLCMSSMI